MFSAYDIKKILPRAVFALIAASLSWSLMSIVIDSVNILGDSTYSLIIGILPEGARDGAASLSLGTGSQIAFVAIAGTAAAGAIAGLLPIAGVAAAAALGILFAFAIVLLRRVILTLMVIIAPIAIVASIFPQTESLFKKWWDWFFKLLLMYPFIMAMFAASRGVAWILSVSGGNNSIGTGTIYDLAAIALLILPYFLIVKALSFAGGTIAKVAGFVNNRDKGLIDGIKKREQVRVAETRAKTRAGDSRFGNNNIFGRTASRGLRRITNPGESLRLSAEKRGAAGLAARSKAEALLKEKYPGIESFSDEALVLASSGSAKNAKEEIERRVAASSNPTEERRKLEAAMAEVEANGGFNSVLAGMTLPKATAKGLVRPEGIAGHVDAAQAALGGGAAGDAARQRAVAQAQAGLKESGDLIGAGLLSSEVENPGAWRAPDGTKGYSSLHSAISGNLGSMSAVDRRFFHDAVDKVFSGSVGLDAIGKMKEDSATAIAVSAHTQASNILGMHASGAISAAEAERQLSDLRGNLLTLGAAATKENNTANALVAESAVADFDRIIAAHGGGGAAAVGTLVPANIEAASDQTARNRTGSYTK